MNISKKPSKLLGIADFFSKPKVAYAHCDVPCGIYEADTMKTAAETVAAMVEKLQALDAPKGDMKAHLKLTNTAARMIATKEEQAQLAKEQILILWTDHFKPEHLEKWPDLHDKVWKATKLCSDAKRSVDLEIVKNLQTAVAEIAKIFEESKK